MHTLPLVFLPGTLLGESTVAGETQKLFTVEALCRAFLLFALLTNSDSPVVHLNRLLIAVGVPH